MARPRSDISTRILHAARARFLREGVDGASLRHIARDAGTNIGMIYYYYPTKDDLFFAVVEEVYVELLKDLELALAPDVPVAERIGRLYLRIGQASEHELEVIRLMVREILVSSARLNRLIDRFQRGHLPLVLRMLVDGLADGTLDRRRHPALMMLCTLAVGAVPQMLRRFVGDRAPFDQITSGQALSLELVEILLGGIGGPNVAEQARKKPRRRAAVTPTDRRARP